MADETIHFGTGPLVVTLGDLVGLLVMHDNGDGTYVPSVLDSTGAYTNITAAAQRKLTAGGTIPANRLVQGYTDSTVLIGTVASKRIIGVNQSGHDLVSGMPLQLGTGFVNVMASEPITIGDLIKCGDGGRVLQVADADNLNTVVGTGTAGNFQNQPSNEAVTIVSDSAADVAVDVTIIGITNGGHTVVEEVKATDATDGTTPVDTVKTNWGVLLAVKAGDHVGTLTIKEKSGGATIVTLAAGTNSAGVVTVAAASQGCHGLIPYIKAGGASTKEVGVKYSPTFGTGAYMAAALNGTTAAPLPAAANIITEIYLGDVATGTVATVYTNATEDDENVIVGRAAETISVGGTGLAYIRP